MIAISTRRIAKFAATLPLLFVAGTAFATTDVAESLGLDFWKFGELENNLRENQRLTQEYELKLQDVQELMYINETILQDVLAGRMTLAAAVQRKWELNRHRPEWMSVMGSIPGSSFESKLAANMMDLAELQLVHSPNREKILNRLSTEYCNLEEQH